MLPAERENSRTMIVEVLPSRYGANVHHLRQADGIELTIGQGAKPGTGGLLLGSKVSPEIAGDPRPAAGRRPALARAPPGLPRPGRHDHQDRGAARGDRLEVPIFVKIGATRTFDDVKLAAKCGADVVVVDGMEGGTAASPEILQDHTGIPTLAAIVEARRALEDAGHVRRGPADRGGRHPERRRRRQGDRARRGRLLHRHGGADRAQLQRARSTSRTTRRSAPSPGACHHCHTGRCPVGVTTQDPELMARLPIDEAAERIANFLTAMTLEVQMLARACGKANIHDLDPEDLRALTLEASLITGIPLVGTHAPTHQAHATIPHA